MGGSSAVVAWKTQLLDVLEALLMNRGLCLLPLLTEVFHFLMQLLLDEHALPDAAASLYIAGPGGRCRGDVTLLESYCDGIFGVRVRCARLIAGIVERCMEDVPILSMEVVGSLLRQCVLPSCSGVRSDGDGATIDSHKIASLTGAIMCVSAISTGAIRHVMECIGTELVKRVENCLSDANTANDPRQALSALALRRALVILCAGAIPPSVHKRDESLGQSMHAFRDISARSAISGRQKKGTDLFSQQLDAVVNSPSGPAAACWACLAHHLDDAPSPGTHATHLLKDKWLPLFDCASRPTEKTVPTTDD